MRASEDDPPLGFLLVRIAEAVDQQFVGTLAELGLKPRELRLLVVIDRGDGSTQRELARNIGVDAGCSKNSRHASCSSAHATNAIAADASFG